GIEADAECRWLVPASRALTEIERGHRRGRMRPGASTVRTDINTRDTTDTPVIKRRCDHPVGVDRADLHVPCDRGKVPIEAGPVPTPVDALVEAAPFAGGIVDGVVGWCYREMVYPSPAGTIRVGRVQGRLARA